MIPVMYGNNYQIVQTPGFVVITYEIIHEARVIPLDGRPHVGPGVRMHMGDARGHWENDTLVVETTNFTKAAAYRGADPATFRVVERFTRVAADTIAVDRDDGGSGDVDEAVDDRDAADSRHAVAAPAVRVPRTQLRPGEYPQGRPRRGEEAVNHEVHEFRRHDRVHAS